jgi:hypothetical protein
MVGKARLAKEGSESGREEKAQAEHSARAEISERRLTAKALGTQEHYTVRSVTRNLHFLFTTRDKMLAKGHSECELRKLTKPRVTRPKVPGDQRHLEMILMP